MKKFTKTLALTIAATSILFTGCSSNQSAAERQAEFMEAKYERDVEVREDKVDSIPDWFLNPEEFDANGFYSVGMGTSDNINIAMTEAKLRAKAALAGNVSELVSAQEKLYSGKVSGQSGTTVQTTIESFIMESDVAGTVFDLKEINVIGDKFVYYTRAYLPVKALAAAKKEAKFAEEFDLTSKDSQRELMVRVATAKANALKEKEAETARIQAAADKKAALLVEQAQLLDIGTK